MERRQKHRRSHQSTATDSQPARSQPAPPTNTMAEIYPVSDDDVEASSPWKRHFSRQYKYTTGRPVPVVEGYLPGAAKNRLSVKEDENSETSRRQRESSIREGTRRRESAAKGESRRFSFMSSAAEFYKLLIESQQNKQEEERNAERKRKPRANKRDRLSSGTFSTMQNDNPKYALLTTYINADSSSCGKTGLYLMLLIGTMLFMLGFILGMGILPVMLDTMIKDQLVVKPDGACFSPKDGGMCPGSVQARYFLWNITNPHEYLDGTQAPRLEEVGPFYYNTWEKVYNASFSENKTVVNYDYTYFWEYAPEDSCQGCENLEDLTIYTANSAYLQVMSMGGGTETALIISFLPQVMSGLYQGMSAVVQTTDAGAQAANLGDQAALDDLVFGQWANCSALGVSLSSLSAYAANDPNVPEVGTWVTNNVDGSTSVSGVSAAVARKIFGVPDPAGAGNIDGNVDPFPDALSFIGGLMMMPEAAFSGLSGVPMDQVATLKGYFYYVMQTYGTGALQAVLGPSLGDQSSGLVIKRTAKALLEGWQDPLLSGFMPGMNMSYNLGFHRDLLPTIDAQMSNGTLGSDHLFIFNKEALTGHYDAEEIGEVVTFEGLREMTYGNGTGPVVGRSLDPSTGFR